MLRLMSIKFLLRRKKQFAPQSDLRRVSQFITDNVLMERDVLFKTVSHEIPIKDFQISSSEHFEC